MISKSEWKYILYSALFSFVYFVIILPRIIPSVDGDSPIFQFIFFNLGLYLFFFIFLKAISLKEKFKWNTALGLVILFFAVDILMPEYHVTPTGDLVGGAALGASASDYILGSFLKYFGVSGFFLYISTYFIIPLAL